MLPTVADKVNLAPAYEVVRGKGRTVGKGEGEHAGGSGEMGGMSLGREWGDGREQFGEGVGSGKLIIMAYSLLQINAAIRKVDDCHK